MPALTSPANAKVLVTGCSGFVAAHAAKSLLERGFRVKGTVRSPAKGDYLKQLYAKSGLGDNFEYTIVKDINEVTPSILSCHDFFTQTCVFTFSRVLLTTL